jgi:hypothetical protein
LVAPPQPTPEFIQAETKTVVITRQSRGAWLPFIQIAGTGLVLITCLAIAALFILRRLGKLGRASRQEQITANPARDPIPDWLLTPLPTETPRPPNRPHQR